jgi:molybdopterin converting factor subunit 1
VVPSIAYDIMHLTIRLFALHREIAGRDAYVIELPHGSTVADAFARVCSEFPEIAKKGGSVAFAVNRAHVGSDAALADGDELAILPPVAGG